MKIEGSTPENKKLWFDTRLTEEEMNFLRDAISTEENNRHKDWRGELAGNISRSELITDKDNWFYETALKKLTERMFYRDWDAYYKYHIEKEEFPPEFELKSIWVNYQKQHEFNPLHGHTCLYSFVIFVKIPTHWEEQHNLPFSVHANAQVASNFQFVWSEKDSEICLPINFSLSSEDEGRMLFFPGFLKHQVYPFYGTEEERITISGNIILANPKKPTEKQEILVGEYDKLYDVYEEREKMIKILENNVRVMKKELKGLEKAREKEG